MIVAALIATGEALGGLLTQAGDCLASTYGQRADEIVSRDSRKCPVGLARCACHLSRRLSG
jgi:hypothetical protein